MIPLARELIKNGMFVVLAANEVPALNDITAQELKVLLRDCGKLDKLLGQAVEEQVITVVSSGSSLPIIDLTKVNMFTLVTLTPNKVSILTSPRRAY